MGFRRDLPPDPKDERPRTRDEYVALINYTFTASGNDWDASEQRDFCTEVGVSLSDWRKAPMPALKRILAHLEKYRMVLFED